MHVRRQGERGEYYVGRRVFSRVERRDETSKSKNKSKSKNENKSRSKSKKKGDARRASEGRAG
jgi:hypothetical protein